MKTDISRKTFDAAHHYSGVRAQQGRVLVDADLNEHADILDYRRRTADTDIIGACGIPVDGGGFEIAATLGSPDTFTCSAGRIYVDGILVENPTALTTLEPGLHGQVEVGADSIVVPSAGSPSSPALGARYAVYLDVWEREIIAADVTDLADPAIPGVDPSTRVKVSWQVRFFAITSPDLTCGEVVGQLEAEGYDGTISVTTATATSGSDPCLGPSSAGYRGTENQLYRIEIHDPGTGTGATWKWSRENAWVVSVVTDVNHSSGSVYTMTVDSTGPDDDRAIKKGDIVEFYSDVTLLHAAVDQVWSAQPGVLCHVDDVTGSVVTVTATGSLVWSPSPANMRLRKWDGAGSWSGSSLTKLTTSATAQDLEFGIKVAFPGGTYKTGQYWLVAARSETGTLLYTANYPDADGPTHHYCVLAFAEWSAGNPHRWVVEDCRETFVPATQAPIFIKVQGDAQRGSPGALLPVPVQVAVGRLAGQAVTFSVEPGSGYVWADDGTGIPSSPTQAYDSIETDEDGIATCWWWMANSLAQRPAQKLTAMWGDQVLVFHAGYRDVCRMWVTEFMYLHPSAQPKSLLLPESDAEEQFKTPPDDPTLQQGRAEGQIGNMGVPAKGDAFEIEVWEDVDLDSGLRLYWDASSFVVYCEPNQGNQITRVLGKLDWVHGASPHLPTSPHSPSFPQEFGRSVRFTFTLTADTPTTGRYVFHLRPKVYGYHGNSPILWSAVTAPYGVLTCYAAP
jgi:hypothetical protein